jgi:uncharacterized coiled-coil DUF342 family protein
MRRFIAFILIVIAAFCLLSGCGTDTGQAQQYLKQGDQTMNEVSTQLGQLAGMLSTINTKVSNPAEMTATVKQIKEFDTELTKKATAAKAEYEKINDLKGVPDYRKYAGFQIKIADDIDKLMTQFNRFVDELVNMVNSGNATQEQASALQDSFQQQVSSLTDDISKLNQEAVKFKADKNL